MKPELVWVDVETTGLDDNTDCLLEVGIILTDRWGDSVPTWEMDWIINEPSDREWMSDWMKKPGSQFVRDMHTKSGLLSDLLNGQGKDMLWTQDDIMFWLSKMDAPLKPPMCGSSVMLDRLFLRGNMPKLEENFHYRSIDVSGMREVASLLNPRVVESLPDGAGLHRPLDDLHDSIALYKHLIDNFFFITNEDAHHAR